MGFNEFAAKAVRVIGKRGSKKLVRKGVKAEALPRPMPTVIKGDSYVCGYASRVVMPKDIREKKILGCRSRNGSCNRKGT